MIDPLFRVMCNPRALDGAPPDWVATLLEHGELAVLADEGGLKAVTALAHVHGLVTIPVIRTERTPEEQERTVIAYAASRPLVWVGADFSAEAQKWARDRGPMTLLVAAAGPLPEDERRRVERFVAVLGRQAE